MERTDQPQHPFTLPFGFFAGPAAWALQILVGYALVPVACQSGSKLGIYLVSIMAAVIILVAGLRAYRNWREYAGQRELEDTEARTSPAAFIAISGALLSTLFFLLVVYTGVLMIFLNPCPVNTIPFP